MERTSRYITLNDQERAEAYYDGIRIWDNANKKHKEIKRISSNKGPEYNVQGVSGEMVVHKYFKMKYRTEIFEGSDTQDIKINGKRYNVKTNNYLGVPVNDKFTDYGFIFVRHDKELRNFEIQGVISTVKFKSLAVQNGRWLNIKLEDLTDIDEVLKVGVELNKA